MCELLTVCVEGRRQWRLQTRVAHHALDGRAAERARVEEQCARHGRCAVTLLVGGGDRRP